MAIKFPITFPDLGIRRGDLQLFKEQNKNESLFRVIFSLSRGIAKNFATINGKLNDSVGGGDATILSGGTSIVVTHGMNFTPTAQDITVTPTENPTNDPGNFWISTITATQFTINCRNDPGASNLDVSWHINRIAES